MRIFLKALYALGLILITHPLIAQPLQKEGLRFSYLEEKCTENLEISRERLFESSGLFGFMNGGAELFLEYGFQQLLEQRLTFQDIPFIVEYYLMDSPENAYGIYSIHTFKCRRADDYFPYECLTPGLLQICHHRLYVTIKCMDKAADAQPLLDRLATLIITLNPINEREKILNLNAFPPPHSGVLYYVCGDLGLSAAYIGWAALFAPYKYTMWLRIDPETGQKRAIVTFASTDDMETFCRMIRTSDVYKSGKLQSPEVEAYRSILIVCED